MLTITVVIPAFNRPELLRVALQSVDRQTAKASIAKIIVSENGLNIASKQVCDEFIDLPITYVFQQPQLPVLVHLKWLMSQEQRGYVALLCDDDWWNPYHLELAIRSLEQYQTCVAYFSNFVYAGEESSLKLYLYHGLQVLHIGRSDFSSVNLISYRQEDILALTVLVTPFHFSAMVCEAKILSQAVAIFDNIHPTYADRILWAALSAYGELLFNPLSTAIVRLHEEMDSKRYSSSEWKQQAQEGSLRVIDLAEKQGYLIKEKINLLYNNASKQEMDFMVKEFYKIFLNKEQLSWFAGYETIIKRALQEKKDEKSLRTVAIRVAKKIINIF